MKSVPRCCRLLTSGELTECLQWALPRYSLERASWILGQITGQVERGQTSQIVAAAASRDPSSRMTRETLLAAAVAIPQVASAATLLLLQATADDPSAADGAAPGPLTAHASEDRCGDGQRAGGNDQGSMICHVLELVMSRLRGLGITFLQAACDDASHGDLLRQAGFQPLANLSLMALPCASFAQARRLASAEGKRSGIAAAATAQWVSLQAVGADWPAIFSSLAARTFIDTRDCPLLSDFRTAEEIVQAYGAAPSFDPALSRLMRIGDDWAGCLVLTQHGTPTARGAGVTVAEPAVALELTYMGLVPEYRRQRLAARLLAETIRVAQQLRASQIVLAVDRANGPAAASYRRFGWCDVAEESVWGRRV